jgi:ketosteroid isomerase-like protein
MTLSSQEISDRLEIQELIAQFSHAVDNRRWSDAIALFTPDAALDYTGIHGPASNPKEVIDHVEQTLSRLKSTQHLVGATTITLNGDTAQARSICHVSGVVTLQAGDHVFFTGLCYADTLTRTPDGWRISARTIEDPWFHNLPTG